VVENSFVLCCCRQFYRSEDYDLLQVSAEVKELFEHVKKYVVHFRGDNQCNCSLSLK